MASFSASPASEKDPALEILDRLNPNRTSLSPSPALGRIGHPGNTAFLEELHEAWKTDPSSVDPTWRAFFEGFELGCQLRPPTRSTPSTQNGGSSPEFGNVLPQARIYNLLFAYRALGHTLAHLDPLGLTPEENSDLSLSTFRFTEADLDSVFDSGTLGGGGPRTLREIISFLKQTYCDHIGVEFMHIMNFAIRRWLRDRMERTRNQPSFSPAQQRRILEKIIAAESLERFLHTRYVGQKRFSLEGGETLIAVLDTLIESCPSLGVDEVVIGMAHRGRLNVLVNTLGKSRRKLFTEFHENYVPETVLGDGDVKYHLGYENEVTTSHGEKIRLSLAPNPSHLEAVNPVVEGKTRARQRLRDDTVKREKVVPVLIHGDGAFIGQGIVAETINLSRLEGYRTGGTIHIIVNNQIAFTTLPDDSRSTRYCTAPGKAFGLPIFHVNGDDPLAAAAIIQLALEFRQKFHEDIILDIVCYRRHGHNEGDEPNFTQPTLYSEIDSHPPVSRLLSRRLLDAGLITEEEIQKIRSQINTVSEEALQESRQAVSKIQPRLHPPISCPALLQEVPTAVPAKKIAELGVSISTIPSDFQINSKIRKVLDARCSMAAGKTPLDWGCAEHLAFASLLTSGTPIRLSGQDSRRGTFSHRHSAVYDLRTRARYIPLKNLSKSQASFCVYNSPLSEAAVLGFDYGYSLDCPDMLVIWEAQFGDFANGAQTQIDQYISSSESKWGTTSRLTLLLPHGYHGQGPEHSSARLERFLQLCAEDNMAVTYPTTPANYFHLVRRQALRKIIKPLIVLTPKGLLRDSRATSPVSDLTQGSFQEILPDPSISKGARRIILCSGKVFYDLQDFQTKNKIQDTAILRLEQLYPLHAKKLTDILSRHSPDAEIIWCQEESENMGAWSHLALRLSTLLGKPIRYVGRDASSSPATGSLVIHNMEQNQLVQEAFASAPSTSSPHSPARSKKPTLTTPRKKKKMSTTTTLLPIRVPSVGESITSGVLGSWKRKNGDTVSSGDPLFEIETDKVTSEVFAEADGTLEILIAEGTEVKVGQTVGNLHPGKAPARKSTAPETPTREKVPSAPVAKTPTRESFPTTAPTLVHTEADTAVLSQTSSRSDRESRKKMSPLRRKIADRLVSAQHTAAILTTFNEADLSNLIALRSEVQSTFQAQHGVKLGFMSFFLQAAVHALKAVPALNARIEGDEIVSQHYFDIGVAVGTEKGLVVPVLRDCDQLDLAGLEKSLAAVATRAREGKLSLPDLLGGVFTISNGGVYGSVLSTPILNPPQSAILGLHAIQQRPVAIGDQVEIRPMMNLALSYDHRLIDGKEAVTFLIAIKKFVENPALALFQIAPSN